MKKNLLRQIVVLVAITVTIVINALADILPINGLGTGQISDSFHVYFVPAGYVFAIWGIIYLGWIAFGIYQALPAQRENERLRSIFGWFIVGAAANSAWIFLWHYQLFGWTLVAMLILLVSLLFVYVHLGIGKTKVSKAEFWCVRVPFSVYLGWISVATIANVADVLSLTGWTAFGLAGQVWAAIMLGVAVVLGLLMMLLRNDTAYLAVLVWAFIGIAVKFSQDAIVAPAAWSAVVLAALMLVLTAFRQRKFTALEK